jgi:hypothetical protein
MLLSLLAWWAGGTPESVFENVSRGRCGGMTSTVLAGLVLCKKADRAVDRLGDAHRHAARRLGVSPEQIDRAAVRRWGRSLADERDAQREPQS